MNCIATAASKLVDSPRSSYSGSHSANWRKIQVAGHLRLQCMQVATNEFPTNNRPDPLIQASIHLRH